MTIRNTTFQFTETKFDKKSLMKKLYVFAALFISTSINAQTVEILDANFTVFLQTNFPDCMSGNLLNTDCAAQQPGTEMNLSNLGITDLTGVEYFTNLTQLFCQDNAISILPTLPPNLFILICSNNELMSLPALPESLVYLYCGENQLTSLPTLPYGMNELMCYDNQLKELIDLPNTIDYIVASNNQITQISNLPNVLTFLDVTNNSLTVLPELPLTMTALSCRNNQLTSLPELPNLTTLHAENNLIECFPIFPSSINTPILSFVFLTIQGNPFTCLPNHTVAMTEDLLEYPICTNDPDINPFNCSSAQSASIDNVSTSPSFFPNPTHNMVQIHGTNVQNIKLMNQLGKVLSIDVNASEYGAQLNMESIPNGVYFIHFELNGKITVERIIKL